LNNLRLSLPVVAASSLRLPLPQLPAFTGCCPLLSPNRLRTSDSHRLFHIRLHRFRSAGLAPGVSTSGWAFDTPLVSTEPCIAGWAVDEYSVSAGSRIFRVCQFRTTSDLRRSLQSLAQPAIPLSLSLEVSPSGWAGGDAPILIGLSFHQPFRQPTPDALHGSSVEVTIRPLNLWKQVQKSSKYVDFTKVGAFRNVSANVRSSFVEMRGNVARARVFAHVFRLTFAHK
jgi:hypothetical protein